MYNQRKCNVSETGGLSCALRETGYEPVTVSELLNLPPVAQEEEGN